MGRKIVLRPLTQIDSHILAVLKQSLGQTFNCPVETKAQIGSLDYAYDLKRKQYLAPLLLSTLRSFKTEPGDRCLGIVDVDLYSPGLNFVFGEADISSRIAIISLHRLKPERYGLPQDEELFQDRAIKEAVHELGHLHYLSHCPDVSCVMHFSNSLADTDIKQASFCLKCQQRLEEARDKP
jgi:archaemetzincin